MLDQHVMDPVSSSEREEVEGGGGGERGGVGGRGVSGGRGMAANGRWVFL